MTNYSFFLKILQKITVETLIGEISKKPYNLINRKIYIIKQQMIPVPDNEFKMVLVGDSSVGKSSILIRFVDDQFSQSLLSTIGVDFKFRKMKIDKKEIKLQIWDTAGAGQETFRSIVSAYYNSADAIVIVYDVTSYQSFQSVTQYWLQEAELQNKNNSLLFLIGNKVDDSETKREVENFSIENLMDKHKINGTFEVSAKTGKGVEQAFTKIAKMLMKRAATGENSTERPKKQNNINLHSPSQNENAIEKTKCACKP